MINVNGKSYTGNNICVNGNKIIIDGEELKTDSKTINISINGNTDKISVDQCDKITVTGHVNDLKTMSGDVEITGDVKGSVKTMSGDVYCGDIAGSITTISGDIRYKKN